MLQALVDHLWSHILRFYFLDIDVFDECEFKHSSQRGDCHAQRQKYAIHWECSCSSPSHQGRFMLPWLCYRAAARYINDCRRWYSILITYNQIVCVQCESNYTFKASAVLDHLEASQPGSNPFLSIREARLYMAYLLHEQQARSLCASRPTVPYYIKSSWIHWI